MFRILAIVALVVFSYLMKWPFAWFAGDGTFVATVFVVVPFVIILTISLVVLDLPQPLRYAIGVACCSIVLIAGHLHGWKIQQAFIAEKVEARPEEYPDAWKGLPDAAIFERFVQQRLNRPDLAGIRAYWTLIAETGVRESRWGAGGTTVISGLSVWLGWFIQALMFLAGGWLAGHWSRRKPEAFQPMPAGATPRTWADDLAEQRLEPVGAVNELARAVSRDDVEKTAALLDAGISADTDLGERLTPLRFAARDQRYAVLQLLLKRGADASAQDESGVTALHYLAGNGAPEDVLRSVVEAGCDVDVRSHSGQTPLFAALFRHRPETALALLKLGADPAVRDARGWSPLHALSDTADDRFSPLEEKLAGEMLRRAGSGEENEWGETPLHLAASRGNRALLERLLAHGAKLDGRGARGTPLLQAAMQGKADTVRFLLKRGAKPEFLPFVMLDARKDVQAMLAADSSLARQVDLDQRIGPLELAVRQASVRMMELLLGAGADPNERGGGPLLAAIDNGDAERARLLLKRGASVEVGDGDRNSALHLAVRREDWSIVKLLLESGADPYAKNERGRTSLDMASGNLETAMKKWLAA